jgi:hypothetical protein
LFSRRLLCRIMEVKCWMAMVLILVRVDLMKVSENLYVVLSWLMAGIWVVPRTPEEITMRGATFQPQAWISSRRGWYLLSLAVILSSG